MVSPISSIDRRVWDSMRHVAAQAVDATSTNAAVQILNQVVSSLGDQTKGQANIISALLNGAEVEGTDATDIIIALASAKIYAGGGDDVIIAGDDAEIDGGDGDDQIYAGSGAKVNGGAGNDYISTYAGSTVDGGDGDDTIRVASHKGEQSTISGGAGNDEIETYSHAIINGGAGDDSILGYNYTTTSGGDGDDTIRIMSASVATVSGGDGNDDIYIDDVNKTRGKDISIDGGAGDDIIRANGEVKIAGGDGNDILITGNMNKAGLWQGGDNAVLDGGDGNDFIQTAGASMVSGGAGDDIIRLLSGGTTVNFDRGDGKDTIIATSSVDLAIHGYSISDVSVEDHGNGYMTMRFADSDDTISFDLSAGSKVNFTFDDGVSVTLRPGQVSGNKAQLTAMVDNEGNMSGFAMATGITSFSPSAMREAIAAALQG